METEEKYDLAKWLAGEMDEAEFTAFRNSPEYDGYERIASASRDFRTEDFDETGMLAMVMERSQHKKTAVIPFYRSAIFRVAAVLVVGLGLFFIFRPNGEILEATASGKTASLVLPDDSKVELNSGSEIAYDKSSWYQHRELSLKGEAFFKVAKGQVFDVHTALGKITVVGTQFNVNAREQRLEVECFEGKVKVSASGVETLLQKGDVIIFENGKRLEASACDRGKPDWMKGEMHFTSASLQQVAREFERRFNLRIKIETQTGQTMTGSFSAENAQKAIESLCAIYKLNARTENDVVVLSANE